jgi:hypothetical protein
LVPFTPRIFARNLRYFSDNWQIFEVILADFIRGIRGLRIAQGGLLQLQPTTATVQDDLTRTHWKLPYAAIVADPAQHVEPAPPIRPQRVDVTEFKLGDTVSFTDKHLRERIGTITRLNAKTCSLLCDGEQWRVSPGLLRKVIDL